MRFTLALAALALPLVATAARGETVQYNASVPSAPVPWTASATLPKFDPALGTLQEVRVTVSPTLRGRVAYENTAAGAATSVVGFASRTVASGPGGLAIVNDITLPVAIQTQAFDGVVDYSGSSGGLVQGLVTNKSVSSTVSTPAAWIGSGTVSVSLTTSNTTALTSGGALTISTNQSEGANVSVTYVYLPFAASYSRPGSLLVFPEYDSTNANLSLLTVTNTDPTGGNLRVNFVYVDSGNCLEFNRTRTLAPNDTITTIASADNASPSTGYCFAYAVSATTGQPISRNVLVGSMMRISGLNQFSYGLPGVPFRSNLPDGQVTDVDGDGFRDLNGIEYEPAPAQIIFPRFIGTSAAYNSDLILINLSGGGRFTATANITLFNDNSGVFSAQVSYGCWAKPRLSLISPFFTRDFLLTTNHNTGEIVGAPEVESGWFRIQGVSAASSTTTISDPSLLAFLVERALNSESSQLPLYVGARTNGDLFPNSEQGDTSGN